MDDTYFDFGDGLVPAHTHNNGGGWVADTAFALDSAYVGSNAQVYGTAWVTGNAQLSCYAKVYGQACVMENAGIYDNAKVFGKAMISGHARVHGDAEVFGTTHISGVARCAWDARVAWNADRPMPEHMVTPTLDGKLVVIDGVEYTLTVKT
jgi:tetrahydrodipicolinate N-succinyltransferase|tara:strand:+ start:522 stop:974 length:453 start_codon:yes stop_codon:yes gene_type:complete